VEASEVSDDGLTRAQVKITKQLTADVEWLHAENGRLKAWVSDLQSGMYVYCVYCGHRCGHGETTPVSMADALKAHIAECPEHPMSGLIKALSALLLLHGKPLREEWLNKKAFEYAVAVHKQASAALAKATSPVESPHNG
jgi:hypothetical protein